MTYLRLKPFGSKEVLNRHEGGNNAFPFKVYIALIEGHCFEHCYGSLEPFAEFLQAGLMRTELLQS